VPLGRAPKSPDTSIVFDETRDDVGRIVEKIFNYDYLDLVAGRYVLGERTSAEYCDLGYRRVVDSGEVNLKTRWKDSGN
jgi:methyl coenzyme M reductase subunit D